MKDKSSKAINFIKKAWSGYSFIFVFFIILFIYSVTVKMNGNIFRWAHVTGVLSSNTGAVVGIIALGMALVIITGQIDLSVGSTLVLVGGFTVCVFNMTNSVILTILAAIAGGLLCGTINGILVGYAKMPPFIVTLSTMLIYRSIAEYAVVKLPIAWTGSSYKYQFDSTLSNYKLFRNVGTSYLFSGTIGNIIPYVTIVFVVMLAIMVYVSLSTKYGKKVYAIGSNEKAARLAGINVELTKVSVFIITGGLAGLASLIHICKNTAITPSTTGASYEMFAIAAVVLAGINMAGGRGKVAGVFFGALSYSTVDKVISASGLDIYIQGAFQGLVLLLVILIQTLGPVIKEKVEAARRKRAQMKLISSQAPPANTSTE